MTPLREVVLFALLLTALLLFFLALLLYFGLVNSLMG